MNNAFSENFNSGDDFYMWVNHHWLEKNPIPSDYQRWGGFTVLDNENKDKIKKILEEEYPKDSPFHKLNIIYKQAFDLENRNKCLSEVNELLKPIENAKTIEELLITIIDYKLTFGLTGPFSMFVSNDFKDSNINILHLNSGGLGLPDRDYYFSKENMNEREKYVEFLERYSKYFNKKLNTKALNTEAIYKIEEYLAEHTYTKIEKRKPELQNNPRNLTEIISDYPSFSFLEYAFKKLGKKPGKINVINPKYLKNLELLFKEEKLQNWKDYFTFRFLSAISSFTTEESEKIFFDFYGKVLSGTPEMKPLWKRALMNTENQLGFLIGKKYVEKNFSENAKKQVLEMIKYLIKYLNDRMAGLDWLGDITKKKALEKLEAITYKVGYPDKWREYKADITMENSYLRNNLNCNIDDNKHEFDKLYLEIDKTQWEMFPQEVNAYYSPLTNEIVFPAGILQPPFFSEFVDKAYNFGAIGTVIGHEITHAFDDQGSKFDAKGDLNKWWTDEDYEKYKLKTEIIKEQYNKYSINNVKVNGDLTLGENIADIGGITIALEGFKKYLNHNNQINSQLNLQKELAKFFISYCIIWRCNTRDEEMKVRLLTDPHSPPEFRVNGVLKNIDDFYTTFKISKENKLYLPKENRAKIW